MIFIELTTFLSVSELDKFAVLFESLKKLLR